MIKIGIIRKSLDNYVDDSTNSAWKLIWSNHMVKQHMNEQYFDNENHGEIYSLLMELISN